MVTMLRVLMRFNDLFVHVFFFSFDLSIVHVLLNVGRDDDFCLSRSV